MKYKIHSTLKKFIGISMTVLQRTINFEENIQIEYEILDRPQIALIIPILNESEIIVIHQYRAAINDFIWEFPAGKKIESETIQQTALRELEEETGFKASKLLLIEEFYTAPHFTNEKVFVFVASELESTVQKLQKHEFIKVHTAELSSVKSLFDKKGSKDSKSLLALQLFLNKSPKYD